MSILDKDVAACRIYDYFTEGVFQYQVTKIDKTIGNEANYLRDIYEYREDRFVTLQLNNVELEHLEEELYIAMTYVVGSDSVLITEIPQNILNSKCPHTSRRYVVQCPVGRINEHPVTSGVITLPIRQ